MAAKQISFSLHILIFLLCLFVKTKTINNYDSLVNAKVNINTEIFCEKPCRFDIIAKRAGHHVFIFSYACEQQ